MRLRPVALEQRLDLGDRPLDRREQHGRREVGGMPLRELASCVPGSVGAYECLQHRKRRVAECEHPTTVGVRAYQRGGVEPPAQRLLGDP